MKSLCLQSPITMVRAMDFYDVKFDHVTSHDEMLNYELLFSSIDLLRLCIRNVNV